MNRIDAKGLLLRIFIPTIVLSMSYLILGHFCNIPYILLFCILGTVILLPMELGMIISASKKEYGTYSLKSALEGQEQLALWKIVLIAFVFFGIAGLLSAFVAPIENHIFSVARSNLLSNLPIGFDWTDYEYLNALIAPITEELFFRGYLTSHYKKQSSFTPILIAVLFSLYHFWLPFNNVFRILAFAPVAYVAYKKKNIYISICFHCLCNLLSVVSFVLEVMG